MLYCYYYSLYHDAWAFPLMWSGVYIAKLPHYVFTVCITFFPRCITNCVIHLVRLILSLMYRNSISHRSSGTTRSSLERDDQIRTYRYRIKPFPQAINETKFYIQIDRSSGRARISLERDDRIALLLETVGLGIY